MIDRRDAFFDCHPAVNFLYFMTVILISMFISHPVLLGCSFLGALAYALRLKGAKTVLKFNLLFTLPVMLVVALVNPAFNHYGVTMLFYVRTGPVTLEAIIYGIVLASMLFIAILWFSSYNEIMTTDKFVYLFGRVIPAMSLVLSMVFRFVPRFYTQLKVIRNGQKAVGRDMSNGNLLQRARYGMKILSILITWALENAIETSDSMRARGYGLKGRTAFSIFRFRRRDLCITAVLLALLGMCLAGFSTGASYASYNPVIRIGGLPLHIGSVITYLAWGIFCLFPVLLDGYEELVFRRMEALANMERHLPWYINEQKDGGTNEVH